MHLVIGCDLKVDGILDLVRLLLRSRLRMSLRLLLFEPASRAFVRFLENPIQTVQRCLVFRLSGILLLCAFRRRLLFALSRSEEACDAVLEASDRVQDNIFFV